MGPPHFFLNRARFRVNPALGISQVKAAYRIKFEVFSFSCFEDIFKVMPKNLRVMGLT